MRSVLNNPLFILPENGRMSRAGRDPMEVFDLAVAKGMMDTSRAKACLSAKKDKIVQSAIVDIRDGMKEAGAGMKVLKWLISSGTSNNNQFLRDHDFAELLMEYLVAEGLQEQAWKWIKRSFDNVTSAASMPFDDAAKLARREVAGPLRALVLAETQHHASFDAAYMCMSRAASYLAGAGSLELTTALQPAGLVLLNRTCMPRSSSSHPPPSESTFESFTSLVPVIIPKRANLFLAHLSLLHPSKPDAKLALDYLRTVDSMDEKEKSVAFKPINGMQVVIQLGLDAAKFLLEQGRHSEAEWTMNFLSTNFPKQLGISMNQRRELEHVKAEASSIEILAGIGIA
jgi:hypothetical protein